MTVIAVLLAVAPVFVDWPHGLWLTRSWVAGKINPERFSLATTTGVIYPENDPWAYRLLPNIDPGTRFWAVSVPGGHQTLGAKLNLDYIDLVAEAGLLSGRDGAGIRSWDAAETGLLPHQKISAGFTRLALWIKPLGLSVGNASALMGSKGRISSRALDGVFVGFGREKRFLSPLVLSGAPGDGLDLMASAGPFAFRYILQELDPFTVETTSWFKRQWVEPGAVLNRFFIGKRVEWAPTRNLTLHISEGAVYSTLDALPRLSALNPLYSMYIYQWTHSDDNNSVWSLGMAYRRPGRFGLMCELLIDDIQYNPDYWDDVPPDLGWWAQMWVLAGSWALVLEHTGTTAWVYNNSRPWDVYRLWGRSMGQEPDQMVNQIALLGPVSGSIEPSIRFWHRLKGANTLDTPNPPVGEYPGDWSLRAPVHQELLVYPGITWVNSRAWFKAEAGFGTYTRAVISAGVFLCP